MSMVRMAVALTVVNLVGVLAGLMPPRPTGAQDPVGVLRGRSLELVDERGQIRARFNVEANGEVVLRLLDQQGTIRVKLGAAKDGSGLMLANDATEPGIHLLAGTKGSSIRVANKDGRERVIVP
jgi:hypothetical protein